MELNAEKAQSFYYSAHHLARDLFWNAGNFSFFLLLSVAIDKNIRAALWVFIQDAAKLNSSVIQIALSLTCLALGAVSGIITNQIYTALVSLFPSAWTKPITYDGFYALEKDRLKRIYNRVFEQNADILLPLDFKEMDLIVRLTGLMRLYNPSGYVHVFRTYSLVSLFRQAIFYSLLLLEWSFWIHAWAPVAMLALAIPVLFLALHHALIDSGTRDYAFILATYQWLEKKRSPA
jgi:hypothetical protein